jgi:hypothetical protein
MAGAAGAAAATIGDHNATTAAIAAAATIGDHNATATAVATNAVSLIIAESFERAKLRDVRCPGAHGHHHN